MMNNAEKLKKARRTNTAVIAVCIVGIFIVFNLMLKSLSA